MTKQSTDDSSSDQSYDPNIGLGLTPQQYAGLMSMFGGKPPANGPVEPGTFYPGATVGGSPIQTLMGLLSGGGGDGGDGSRNKQQAKTTSQQQPSAEDSLFQFLQGKEGQLNFGQIENPNQQLVQQLSQAISGMSLPQAQALIKGLPQGSTLQKDVESSTGPPSTNDALTMGLGMFFQQYLAPQLAMINQANTGAINSWGNMMQNALSQNLPAGVKQTVGAFTPMIGQLMQMLNASSANQAGGAGQFQALIQGLGQQTSATQALQDAFLKAATYQSLGAGTQSSLQGLLSSILGPNSLAGGLAQLLSGSSGVGLPGVPGISSAAGANQSAAAGYQAPTLLP